MILGYTLSEQELCDRDSLIEEYIDEMSRGDTSAMGRLYELIRTDVYAYALSKTGRREDAEDVMQDTFVQIWKNAALYRPMGKPLAWIFTVELNLIRRQFNLAHRCAQLDGSIEIESDGGDFAQRVIDNEFLRELMKTLDEDEREIISLHVVSGMKHREIAELLSKPLSTVLSRYNRAIKKLQQQSKRKGDSEDEKT